VAPHALSVSEVVLLPGPDAMVAPVSGCRVQQRVQAGDLGVGDLMPPDPGDPRLVPAYLSPDDPAVEEVAHDAGSAGCGCCPGFRPASTRGTLAGASSAHRAMWRAARRRSAAGAASTCR